MYDKCVNFLQLFFGICLIIFGLKLIPVPEKEGFAKIFMDALHQAKYLMPTIVCIQILAGLSLVFNRCLLCGLLALLPVSFNIFAFHLFHDRGSLVPASLIFILNIFFIIRHHQTRNLHEDKKVC